MVTGQVPEQVKERAGQWESRQVNVGAAMRGDMRSVEVTCILSRSFIRVNGSRKETSVIEQ